MKRHGTRDGNSSQQAAAIASSTRTSACFNPFLQYNPGHCSDTKRKSFPVRVEVEAQREILCPYAAAIMFNRVCIMALGYVCNGVYLKFARFHTRIL